MGLPVVAPLGSAWTRMKRVLFRKPVSPGKWFALGLCAFLAILDELIASYLNTGSRLFFQLFGARQTAAGGNLAGMLDWVRSHAMLVVATVGAGLLTWSAIMGVCRWFSARGRFMHLHCAVADTDDFKSAWSAHVPAANSHALARITLHVLLMSVVVAPAVFGGWRIATAFHRTGWPLEPADHIEACLWLIWCLFWWAQILIAEWLLSTFLLPIQYHRHVGVWGAWKIFRREVLPGNGWSIVCFSLMQMVVGLAWGTLVTTVGLLTCCVGFFVLGLPVLGQTLLAPCTVWMDLWKVRYLEQLGPAWTMICDRGRCPGCDYDLRGTPTAARCPECGMVIPDEARPAADGGAPAA